MTWRLEHRTAKSACPDCGNEGPHEDNGATRRQDLSFCCVACGCQFDAIVEHYSPAPGGRTMTGGAIRVPTQAQIRWDATSWAEERKAIRVPTQAQIDTGIPPRGYHWEFDSASGLPPGGLVLVRNGWHCKVLNDGSVTAARGTYGWRAYKTLPSKAELDAMRGAE